MNPINNNNGITCQQNSFSEEHKKKLHKQKQATDLFLKQLPPIINENEYIELKNKIKKQTSEDVNFNFIDENGETLFMHVIQMRNPFLANLLLKEETLDLKLSNNDQFSCFFYAVMNDKNTSLLKKMCEKDPEAMKKKAKYGMSLLHAAAQSASLQALKYLHEIQNFSIHDVDERKWTPLHYAAKSDQNLDNLIYLM